MAPLKRKETIPRLELLGNLLLSRLVQSILKAVETELTFDNIICFTDSQVSLSWIKTEEKELKTFVQNRVIEIRQNVKAENWSYCRTNENPADLVTRIEGNGVENTIWWEGADFLKSNKLDVTKYNLPEHLVFDFEKEVRIIETMTFTNSELKTIENIIDIHKYSDLLRLYRITALVKRFCENLKSSVTKQNILRSEYLTAQEIRDARKLWIEANQR